METKMIEIFQNIGICVNTLEEEVEIDSFQFVNIIVEIENEYVISVDETDLLNGEYKSVQDFCNLVKKYISLIEE